MDFEDWIRAELSGTRPPAAPRPAAPRWWSGLGTPLLIGVQVAVSALAVTAVFSGAAFTPRLEATHLGSLAPAPALPANTWAGSPPPPPAAAGKPNDDVGRPAPAADTPGEDGGGRTDDPRGEGGPAAAPPAQRSPSSPPPAAQSSRTFVLIGGSATVACRSGAATLVSATPNPGYQAETESEDGGQGVDVRFRSQTHESRLDATCSGGTVQGQIEESSS